MRGGAAQGIVGRWEELGEPTSYRSVPRGFDPSTEHPPQSDTFPPYTYIGLTGQTTAKTVNVALLHTKKTYSRAFQL